jgi:hypothetical protein
LVLQNTKINGVSGWKMIKKIKDKGKEKRVIDS